MGGSSPNKTDEAAVLQGQLARAIINALHLKPTEVVKKDITESRTTNPEAYEFYLRAKFLFEKKKTKEDILTARGMYQKAIDLDSTFTLAHLGTGETYLSQGEYEEAGRIYQRALGIAQRTGEKNEEASSLSRLGIVEWYQGNFSKALEYHSQSLKLMLETGNRGGEGRDAE